MEIEKRAQGCLVGAFVGDSAGARLEFIGRKPTQNEIDEAVLMKGGGALRVAPGQVTDDGELTLALARALVGARTYPRDAVAARYRDWYASSPFDVGQATSNALGGPLTGNASQGDSAAGRAAKFNMESKANGALMRISPLGIWATRMTMSEAVAAARTDASLTHPHLCCQWANAAYVVAIRHLLTTGDVDGAFTQAVQILVEASDHGAKEVRSWLDDAKSGALPACHPQIGFVRIGFTHAFHHLLRESPFEEALRIVLAGGGDTDTNACIVGALVGARVGLDGIPPHMSRAVLECDTDIGRPRPRWLQTRDALDLVSKLVG